MKNKLVVVLGILSIFFTFSCKEESGIEKNEKGEITVLPFKWVKSYKSAYADSYSQYNYSYYKSIAIKNLAITYIINNESAKIAAINSENGEIVWAIDNNTDEYIETLYSSYIFDNSLYLPHYTDIKTINLLTGQPNTIYHFGSISHNPIIGNGNIFYTTNSSCQYFFNEFNTYTNTLIRLKDIEEIPDFDSYSGFIAAYEKNSKPYVVQLYTTGEWEGGTRGSQVRYSKSHLRVFDVDNNSWLYDSIIHSGNYFIKPYIFDDNVICLNSESGNAYCHNILNGKFLWQDSSNYIGVECIRFQDTYISSTEANGLSAHNLSDGYLIWQNQDINAYYIQEHNGIIYCIDQYANLTDTKNTLCAIDAVSGKVLWRLKSPNEYGFSKITVTQGLEGGKAKIVAETYEKIYCYETIN